MRLIPVFLARVRVSLGTVRWGGVSRGWTGVMVVAGARVSGLG